MNSAVDKSWFDSSHEAGFLQWITSLALAGVSTRLLFTGKPNVFSLG
jgi:hypothetical protein